MCHGANDSQKELQNTSKAYYNTLIDQAKQVFGESSQVFQELKSAVGPIVAAGPSQQGYDAATLADLTSQNVTDIAQAGRNVQQAEREAQASFGGGNMPMAGGASIATDLATKQAIAEQTASANAKVRSDSRTLGRANWLAANSILAGAPSVFNPATNAAGTANSGGQVAGQRADAVQQADLAGFNSWFKPVMGAIGGVLGGVAGGMAGGGGLADAGGGAGADWGAGSSSFGNGSWHPSTGEW
jgi:hypothetical protein